jgi:hypothetical protein
VNWNGGIVNAFLKKTAAYFGEGVPVSEKYSFIEAENATVAGEMACAPTVTQMCCWLQVSRSGFYEWRARSDRAAAKRRNELTVSC